MKLEEIRVNELRAERDEWKRRAEAAEAQLAAVPDPADRLSTHWESCWRDGGVQHHACTVARAQELEAALAAVPVESLRHIFGGEYYPNRQWDADIDTVRAWLAQQPEVQP